MSKTFKRGDYLNGTRKRVGLADVQNQHARIRFQNLLHDSCPVLGLSANVVRGTRFENVSHSRAYERMVVSDLNAHDSCMTL